MMCVYSHVYRTSEIKNEGKTKQIIEKKLIKKNRKTEITKERLNERNTEGRHKEITE